jgi:serine/threonine protein kinase
MLGRYEIQEEIGRGMMGVVYRALDPALGRTVALKTVSLMLAVPEEDRASFEQRFLNEARVAAGLSHPAIVVVHDVGRDPESNNLYIALEYLHGTTLADRVRAQGALPWREALRLTGRLADALQHAHEREIVHRDVKPANIMVLPTGEPKLMDFGIAKVPAAQLTAAGDFFGTPSYMSPEQASSEPLDGRSDVFSLGAVLYLMLTAARAFDAPTVPAILSRVAHVDPPPPSTLVPELPAAVDLVVARALAKDRAQRYASARELAEDVEDVLAGRAPRHASSLVALEPQDSTIQSLLDSATPVPEASAPAPPSVPTPSVPTPSPASAAAVPAAAGRPAPPPSEPGRATLTERYGRRGALVVAAILAVGIAFPLAARRQDGGLGGLPTLAPAVEPAQLEITLDHPLRSGTLRVYVDDDVVAEEALSGRVTKKILSFRMRKGSSRQLLEIPPGEHVIRVEIDGEGFGGSRRIRGNFKSGQTRRLEATIDGLIKKDLTLVWGS